MIYNHFILDFFLIYVIKHKHLMFETTLLAEIRYKALFIIEKISDMKLTTHCLYE